MTPAHATCRAILVAVMLAVPVPLPVHAAPPAADSIKLEMTSLTLGMSQQKVLDMLAERFKVAKFPGSGDGPFSSWTVMARTAPFTLIGNVTFNDGQLTSVIKYWGPNDQQKGVEVASALYGALAQFIKEGKRSCVIDTSTNQTPQAEMKSAFITCGGKYLDVSIVRTNGFESASISEFLQSPEHFHPR